MIKQLRNRRWWLVVPVAGWIVIVLTSLIGPSASAQPRAYTPEPPFDFVPVDQSLAPDIGLPPGNTPIFTETFETGFSPVPSLDGSLPLWRVVVDPADTAGYYWGRVASGAYLNTAWTAVTPISGQPVLIPGVSAYPAGQRSWLLYGPLDLHTFAQVRLVFRYSLDAAASDKLLWGATYDGNQVFGTWVEGQSGGWVTGTLQLDPNGFRNNLTYLAFGFEGDENLAGLGAFIDDVKLIAQPLSTNYFPLVMGNYPPTPTPTPTATPIPALFSSTFNPGNNDLAAWGGRFDGVGSGSGGTYGYGQCLPGDCRHPTNPHGNPANSLRLYNTAYWVMVASSPNYVTPADYELHVDVSPVVLYPRDKSCGESCPPDNLGNWYGIIFNASNNTFGATPGQFNYNGQYYRFFFYNIDAVLPIGMALDRCSGGSCTRLGTSSVPGGLLNGLNLWDRVRIRRVGATIQVYVNDVLILNRTDSTYLAGGKFGVFTFPSDGNATQYPPTGYEQQIDFDNIRVYNP